MMRLWDGSARDDFATAIVIATTGAALFVAGAETDIARADQMAEALWEDRQT
jgi:anthranilate phosphoribosyltransferase